MSPFDPPPTVRLRAWLGLVLSAAGVALALHATWRWPWVGVLLVLGGLALLVPHLRARQRARRLLTSGDVRAIFAAWEDTLEGLPHSGTMGPLIAATALVANGHLERARTVLEKAERGPAWEAALEHRLFVQTLLEAFEGDREEALATARRLGDLPLPPVGPKVRDRVATLRAATGALARAFAHRATAGDAELLRRVSERNPLVHWAMRYASAVAFLDLGRTGEARAALADAPAWPEDSAFHAFHAELDAVAASRSGATPA